MYPIIRWRKEVRDADRIPWFGLSGRESVGRCMPSEPDFGVGFYVTDIRAQAERWALRVLIYAIIPQPGSVYISWIWMR